MTGKDIKKHWDDPVTESMYDKNLLDIETNAIFEQLDWEDRVIDIGCGEGEGTLKYHEKAKYLLAVDFSETRLEKLRQRNDKIRTALMDMRELSLEKVNERFTKAITQRSLINLESFEEQKKVIESIHSLLEDGGRYLMLEGFVEGVEAINKIRNDFKLPPIGVKWHNCFFNKERLLDFMSKNFNLEHSRDFSLYFFMTRVFNAIIKYPEIPVWNDTVNTLAKEMEIKYKNDFIKGVSRLELLVFRKK